ncbi:hypothetical protein [Streptomyces sp. AS02]|uniref:hypothetical protein n=1 Tax=Streptomyces sp. AS02 TaxID=2938946 RepID=UPI00202003B0|nr:hypothetical protein [Streptomyces sp. AS02]MCL8013126.1 hypothetical protein [Streptomyces sp. AS02]
MPRTPTPEDVIIAALRDGDTATVEEWAWRALRALVPGRSAAPAVRHPLEFTCLPLYRHDDSGLCLHVWTEDDEAVSPVVHAHSWDLWSYVLCGTVFNQVVTVRDCAERPEHRLYEARSVGGVDEMRATERLVGCTPQVPQEIPAGHIYRLPSGVFHRSGHRGLSATIVLGEHHAERKNLVLGPLDVAPPPDLPRVACPPDEVRDLVQRVLGLRS